MQLTRVFGSLADTYGHIIRTNLAEVDLKDVVLNRRILVVLLPALEKSPEELANLGKIIIASLKAMMAAGLGDSVEGDYRDVILRKPTNAPSPYVCIMDEYGYYAVKGFAVVAAQARSLGFCAVFAGQDLPAFQKASKEEAASIGANCNIKICMKLEDPMETWEFFNKTAGETYVTNVSGFQMNSGSMTLNYMDTRNASVDRRQRIELLDLKDQREGEAHIFFKSSIIRASMFYANPKPVKQLQINHYLKVDMPPEVELINLNKRFFNFREVLENPRSAFPPAPPNDDIGVITHALNESYGLKPFERGVAALIGILEHEVAMQRELNSPFESKAPIGKMTAFTSVPVTPLIEQMIGKENVELFSQPLISGGLSLEDLKVIERLAGNDNTEAAKAAKKLISEIETTTDFPPPVDFRLDKTQMLSDINDIIVALGGTPPPPPPPPPQTKQAVVPVEQPLAPLEDVLQPPQTAAAIESNDKKLSDLQDALTGLSDLPQLPPLPELPELPDIPDLPQMPLDTPGLSDLPPPLPADTLISAETDIPQSLDLPNLAELPELQDVPNLDELESLLSPKQAEEPSIDSDNEED